MMLQRAASNAYSWWWASHIRTKQSKWLEENLQDLEEKVNYILKIINEDGDTFAQRAEMYYRKRPEIVGFVEEAFRSYRALAERFDHLSRELQSANRTIATVFPEHVQFPSDEEDEENPEKKPKFVAKGANIPKVPEVPKKDFRSRSSLLSRQQGKTNLRRTSSSDSKREIARSGFSKGEALEEIDKLQKGILARQTEKEFVRSAYESLFEKYQDIENEVTELQKRVCSLQDEFGIGAVIEDGEARMLMASTALSSCRDSVAKLEEKQKESAQEAEAEKERIISSKQKFDALRRKFDQMDADSTQREEIEYPGVNKESELESYSRDFVEEEMAVGSEDVLTVMQLVEKIDALVERVVSLETDSVSQTGLVETLRRNNDELQEHILELDKDNAALISGSEEMGKRIGLLEDEISRIKSLYQKFEDQNKTLQTHSTEAKFRINDLSGKLHSVKMDGEIESSGIFQEARSVSGESKEEEKDGDGEEIKIEKEEEEKKKDEEVLDLDVVSDEKQQEKKDCTVSETASSVFDSEAEEMETEEEEEETPDLRQSFPNGIEDRENILLEEYGSVLRNYREVKKKLRDVEKKNRDGFFELALQVRELKNNIADRDIEIQKLREKLESPRKVSFNQTEENQSEHDGQPESISQLSISPVSNFLSSSTSSHMQREDLRKTNSKSRGNDVRVTFADPESNIHSPNCDGDNNNGGITEVEERIRSDIDELLEQNLEFWLRFSTSIHQSQKFQTSVHDLKSDFSKLSTKKAKKQQDFGNQSRLASEARPIYRHLREVKTELQLWLENNTVLKEELQGRHSSLCNIQDEISRVTGFRENASATISDYQAAKFHGEVLNMKQENTRVSDELESGLERVGGMKIDVERMLKNAEDDFGIANAQNAKSQNVGSGTGRARIPLRSFLFGVKLKRHKQQSQKLPSLFSCAGAGPSLQKQSSYTRNLPARLPE